MSEAYQLAKEVCEKQLYLSLVPKTVDELERLIASRPDHPAAIDLRRAIEPYHGYDVIVRVSPVTVAAIEQNREVEVQYSMEPVVSSRDKTIYKKTKKLALGIPRATTEKTSREKGEK